MSSATCPTCACAWSTSCASRSRAWASSSLSARCFDTIPPDVAMDEAFVEALVVKRGLEVRYAPDAMVYNMGPTTVSDFIRQRRRNYAGHLHLKKKYGYKVSSLDSTRVHPHCTGRGVEGRSASSST